MGQPGRQHRRSRGERPARSRRRVGLLGAGVIGPYVRDKETARLQQVEQLLPFYCRSNHGMVWLSSRTLANKRMFKGSSETLRIARQLAADGHVGRATARGRGRGKGRTLYWLPNTKKWVVLQELRREDMPHSAIVAALGFFARKERIASAENVTDGAQQRSLGLSTFGTEAEEGAPAQPAQRARAPSGPRRRPTTPSNVTSTPPSDGRLVSHGFAQAMSKRRVDGQISEALSRMRKHVSSADNSPKLGGP